MHVTDKEKLTEVSTGKLPARTMATSQIVRFFPAISFVVCFFALWIARMFGVDSSLADLILLCAATVVTLFVFGQRFPLQNVVGLAVTIAIFSGIVLLVATVLRTSMVLPLFNKHFDRLPAWTFPLLWIVALVNARGIAKLVLYRWRKIEIYGWWLIGLSSVLVAGFNLPMEFSGRLFLMQVLLAAVAFAVTTPWFMDKRNVDYIPDFQPLLVIILIICW